MMTSYKRIQNRLHKVKMEIMELEESVRRAELAKKPFFAKRLRMIIEKKVQRITFLTEEE
jgi:hypothetical protein